MPPHPAFLSCVLCLQIRDRNLCRCGAVAARAIWPTGKCRRLSEVLALRRLQIPARDVESRGRRYDDARADRKHAAVVRTQAQGTGNAFIVEGLCLSRKPSEFRETPAIFQYATRSGKCSRPSKAVVSGEL